MTCGTRPGTWRATRRATSAEGTTTCARAAHIGGAAGAQCRRRYRVLDAPSPLRDAGLAHGRCRLAAEPALAGDEGEAGAEPAVIVHPDVVGNAQGGKQAQHAVVVAEQVVQLGRDGRCRRPAVAAAGRARRAGHRPGWDTPLRHRPPRTVPRPHAARSGAGPPPAMPGPARPRPGSYRRRRHGSRAGRSPGVRRPAPRGWPSSAPHRADAGPAPAGRPRQTRPRALNSQGVAAPADQGCGAAGPALPHRRIPRRHGPHTRPARPRGETRAPWRARRNRSPRRSPARSSGRRTGRSRPGSRDG